MGGLTLSHSQISNDSGWLWIKGTDRTLSKYPLKTFLNIIL